MRAVPSRVHYIRPFGRPYRIRLRDYEYQFCSLSTLTRNEWRFIYDHMSFAGGGIRYWRDRRQRGIRMSLLYYNKHLIAWCAIDTECSGALGARSKSQGVTCWVLDSWRNKGIATRVIEAALKKYKVPVKVDVYSDKMEHICKKLGHKPTNIWD